MLSLIVCMDNKRGIGKNNSMPWHLPKELAYFKEVTKDNLVIFGRKTWESLPKKPLPDRKNAVMTGDIRFRFPQVWRLHHLEDILWLANHDKRYKDKEVFVCGGQSLYEQCLPYADKLYLTVIDAEFDCDTFFPDFYKEEWWIGDIKEDSDNGYDFQYIELIRA